MSRMLDENIQWVFLAKSMNEGSEIEYRGYTIQKVMYGFQIFKPNGRKWDMYKDLDFCIRMIDYVLDEEKEYMKLERAVIRRIKKEEKLAQEKLVQNSYRTSCIGKRLLYRMKKLISERRNNNSG